MEFYLLRHGATAGNLLGQYIGSIDQPLVEKGIADARALVGRYPAPERLWVSPMVRARQTASILFPNAEQHVVESFRELDFGAWEEHTWDEVGDPAVYDGWLSGDLDAAFPGGETQGAFGKRTADAFKSVLLDASEQGTTLGCIVAHGGVLMSLMSQFATEKRENMFAWMPHNCGGFHVKVNVEQCSLELVEEFGK